MLRRFFELLPENFSAEHTANAVIDPLERMYKDKMQVSFTIHGFSALHQGIGV